MPRFKEPPHYCPDGSNPCGKYGYCAYCPHDKKAKKQEREVEHG